MVIGVTNDENENGKYDREQPYQKTVL